MLPDIAKIVSVDAAALKKPKGVYSGAQIGKEITVKAMESGLLAQVAGQSAFPLEAVSDAQFANDVVGVGFDFTREADTPASSFLLSQGGSRIPFTRK